MYTKEGIKFENDRIFYPQTNILLYVIQFVVIEMQLFLGLN